MAIKNYTTKVDVYTSIGEIQGALARHGATKIMIDYDNGKPQAIAFGIDTPAGPRGFRLPAAVDGTLRVFANQKIKADRETVRKCAAENCCHGAAPRRSSTGHCRALRFFRRRMKSTSGTAFPPSGRWRTTPCAALFAAWTSSRSNPGHRSSLIVTIPEVGTSRIAKSRAKRLRQSTPVAFAGRSSRR